MRRGEITPYDESSARRHTAPAHPHEMMNQMMMPFGGHGGGLFGGGGGFGGGIFQQMDQMMAGMQQMQGMQMQGMHPGMQGMQGMHPGMQGMQMQAGGFGGGGGGFSCQTMSFSSSMGADGQMHTEQFSSSSVGDQSRDIRETQQAYSNSNTGVDKMSMERQFGEQGRKMVKERSRTSGEERQTEMFRGITEEQAPAFNERWQQDAAPHIPAHLQASQLTLGDGGRGGYGGGGRHSMPAPATGYGGYGGHQQGYSQPAPARAPPSSHASGGYNPAAPSNNSRRGYY